MKRFEIAHLKVQGVDLIVVPLHASFGILDPVEQTRLVRLLQQAAKNATLIGTVVPVWGHGAGRMGFIAHPSWHPYFQSIDLVYVEANINRELVLDQAPGHFRPARQLDNS